MQRPELAGVRVLIVDDDEDNREMLSTVLELSGALVTTAHSAAEALRVLEREVVEVLVSDIGLPDEDGFGLLRKARALHGPRRLDLLPAVALTGYASPEDKEQARAAGFQALLTKPVAIAELLSALVRVLRAQP